MFYSGGWSTLKKLIYHRAFNASGGGTETTVTGVSPLLLDAALAHGIKSLTQYGKMEQDGTPTPDSPIYPRFNNGTVMYWCGDKFTTEGQLTRSIIGQSDGRISSNTNYNVTAPIRLLAGDYTATFYEAVTGSRYFRCWSYKEDGETPIANIFDVQTNTQLRTIPFTLAEDTYVRFSYRVSMTDMTCVPDNPRSYTDGTPEVITLGEQTASAVNLYAVGDYADEQEIISGPVTRRVGMHVFDGTEAIGVASGTFRYTVADKEVGRSLVCSHFLTSEAAADPSITGHPTSKNIYFRYGEIETAADFKAFLAAQYAQGTPVIVWYPLAEPYTEQTAPQRLSTAKGDNVLSWTAAVEGKTMSATYYTARLISSGLLS